ncbi:MAG: DUF512 domain-containing protein [Candidatus Eisenbacteria bacterium]
MPRGVRIEEVEAGSPAGGRGIRAGDRLLRVNGREVEDHLDVRFHAALGDLDLLLERSGETIRIRVPEEPHPLRGLVLEEIRPRLCGSDCIFCFIDQLPPGVRPSLLVKDEDFRLSFLHGNYITLSTLRERDIERIIEQRLSPLYVSVHAVDDEVRAVLLGRRPRRTLLPTMDRLLRAGIEIWGQVVLCPGVNDGKVLDETVDALAGRHPGVKGVAVVPVSLSAHARPHPLLRPVTAGLARAIVLEIGRHQEDLLSRIGSRFVFAADELLLEAGASIPPAGEYEDFGMIEDGVGMVRRFADLFDAELERTRGGGSAIRDLTIVTGTLFAPVLEPLLLRAEEALGTRLRLLPVENRFLGPGVSVAGLLSGRDIVRAIRDAGAGGIAALPAETVSRANGLLLDDYTPDRVRSEAGLEGLRVVDGPAGLFRLLREGSEGGGGGGTYPLEPGGRGRAIR